MGLVQSIGNCLRLWPSWHKRCCPSKKASEKVVGEFGERAAASFLREQGYKILVKRYRTRQGEVDIVCRHAETLVFVEVKARSRLEFGRPGEFVGRDKQRRLTKAALDYLRLLGNPPIYFRFDIVEVELAPGQRPKCLVIKNAFELPEPYLY